MNARISDGDGPAASSPTASSNEISDQISSERPPPYTANMAKPGKRSFDERSSDKKLSSRWFRPVHSLLTSTAMAFAMTLIITAVNIGLVDDFFQRWLKAFAVAYVFALPLTFLLTEATRSLTARFVEIGDN